MGRKKVTTGAGSHEEEEEMCVCVCVRSGLCTCGENTAALKSVS